MLTLCCHVFSSFSKKTSDSLKKVALHNDYLYSNTKLSVDDGQLVRQEKNTLFCLPFLLQLNS